MSKPLGGAQQIMTANRDSGKGFGQGQLVYTGILIMAGTQSINFVVEIF